MTLTDFLSRLDGVEKHGSYYMAKCPAHADQRASLSVSTGKNGGIVLKCHAGCSAEDIVSAMGLTMSDLFPDDQRRGRTAAQDFKPIEKPTRQFVAAYQYADGAGKLLAEKLRYRYSDGGKSFSWRQPNGRHGWTYNRKGLDKLPLYRYETLGAFPPDAVVFLVEGEKDVDTLQKGGLCALCSPDGAGHGKWREYMSESLRGRSICVIQDNDDIGKAYANEVCTALMETAKRVQLMDLTDIWDEVPEHGDITDYIEWCRRQGQGDEVTFPYLVHYVADLPCYCPADAPPEYPDKLALFKSVSDFVETEAEWLIPGWLPSEQITLLASDGGVGKTTICCNIIAAVSSGAECILDPPIIQRDPKKVIILTTEDSISKKLKKKLRLLGANQDNVIAPDPAMDVNNELRELKFGSPMLADVIRQYKPALCVLDPVQGYVPPDINMGARNAMRDCMATLTSLGEETGCTFLVVCHSNKRRGASGRERISDSSDLWDIARSVIMAGFTEEDGIRYLSNEKNNYDKLQDTVLFTISNDGLPEHRGFSQKHDRDYVQASYIVEKPEEPLNEKLLEALKDAASPFDAVRFSYTSFEEQYGAMIYGGKQPKKALDAMKPYMEEAGYSLVVKKIKIDARAERGFVIQPISEDPQQLPVCV